MKKTFVSIIVISFLLSCKKNFLDVAPRDSVSDATFWRNEADANAAATGVYSYWSFPFDDGVNNVPARALFLGDAWSDDATTSNFWNGFW